MEQVEEVEPGFSTTERVAIRNRLVELTRPPPANPRYVLFSLSLQIVLLALVGAAAYALVRSLVPLRHEARVASSQLAALTAKVDALVTRDQALESEVSGLRQAFASTTSEDVLFLKVVMLKPDIDINLAHAIARHVHHYASLYGRDPNLVLAIISVESRFNPQAVSPVGAEGLMQVMPHWKRILGITGDLKDPETSIQYGLQVLGFYQQMYKDLEVVLTAYNRGPGPVDKALMQGTSPMNKYAPQVLQTYDRLVRLSAQYSR